MNMNTQRCEVQIQAARAVREMAMLLLLRRSLGSYLLRISEDSRKMTPGKTIGLREAMV